MDSNEIMHRKPFLMLGPKQKKRRLYGISQKKTQNIGSERKNSINRDIRCVPVCLNNEEVTQIHDDSGNEIIAQHSENSFNVSEKYDTCSELNDTKEDFFTVEDCDNFDKKNEQYTFPDASTALSFWATKYSINHNALTHLLKIFKKNPALNFKDLPLDSRTLMKTPITTKISLIFDQNSNKYFSVSQLNLQRTNNAALLGIAGIAASSSRSLQLLETATEVHNNIVMSAANSTIPFISTPPPNYSSYNIQENKTDLKINNATNLEKRNMTELESPNENHTFEMKQLDTFPSSNEEEQDNVTNGNNYEYVLSKIADGNLKILLKNTLDEIKELKLEIQTLRTENQDSLSKNKTSIINGFRSLPAQNNFVSCDESRQIQSLPQFPIDQDEDFVKFNKSLNQPEVQKELRTFIRRIGGEKRKKTNLALGKIITDQLARRWSWTGWQRTNEANIKQKKLSDTNFSKYFIESLIGEEGLTEEEIRGYFMSWFRRATDRINSKTNNKNNKKNQLDEYTKVEV